MAKVNKDKPSRLTVSLVLPHEHGGIAYKAGSRIEVSAAQARWLQARGIIAPTTDNPGAGLTAPLEPTTPTED